MWRKLVDFWLTLVKHPPSSSISSNSRTVHNLVSKCSSILRFPSERWRWYQSTQSQPSRSIFEVLHKYFDNKYLGILASLVPWYTMSGLISVLYFLLNSSQQCSKRITKSGFNTFSTCFTVTPQNFNFLRILRKRYHLTWRPLQWIWEVACSASTCAGTCPVTRS